MKHGNTETNGYLGSADNPRDGIVLGGVLEKRKSVIITKSKASFIFICVFRNKTIMKYNQFKS